MKSQFIENIRESNRVSLQSKTHHPILRYVRIGGFTASKAIKDPMKTLHQGCGYLRKETITSASLKTGWQI